MVNINVRVDESNMNVKGLSRIVFLQDLDLEAWCARALAGALRRLVAQLVPAIEHPLSDPAKRGEGMSRQWRGEDRQILPGELCPAIICAMRRPACTE